MVSGLPVVLLPLIPSNPLAPFFSFWFLTSFVGLGFVFFFFFAGTLQSQGPGKLHAGSS